MYISQCIIAKNEEENIGYCLSHLKTVVDEQIVVDSGSTDRTVEIAEKLGAKIFHFDWINDFSAARNFALDQAKGDWIIFLDCDEYFTESSVGLIKKYIKEINGNRNINGIYGEMINIDRDKNAIGISKNISPRIFRKRKNIRYRKPIHEVLSDFNREEANLAVLAVDRGANLKILHTGYDKGVISEKNKNERNILMLKIELEQNPTDSQLNLYISKSYFMDGAYEEALEYARNALKYMDESKQLLFYPIIYSTMLTSMFLTRATYDEMKVVYEEAVSKYAFYPDYYRVMGVTEMREGNNERAIELLEKCIECCKNYNSFVESLAAGQIDKVYSELLNAYIRTDNKPRIVEISVALLNGEKYSYENLFILIRTLLTSESEENIIEFLTKLYDYTKFKDKLYLLKVSEKCENDKMISYFNSILSEEEKQAVKGIQYEKK
ncbi:hypothetical protein SDC9_73876 [bioreactor metagenome]|uniref:Glycosyltransferase 2-like domain-containing protein n=1 Tax=bioreactor metagenome TaxID=1076179 RepID=A0A644YFT7_9ZZZZ